VNAFDGRHGFQFQDEKFLDHEIEPISDVQSGALVANWKWPLSFDKEPAHEQLVRKAGLISRFEQASPQFAVYLDGRADDFEGKVCIPQNESSVRSVRSVVDPNRCPF
jgi:hypothetical protein